MEIFTLNDGNQLPAVGFGTVALKGASGVNAILSALNAGYRMIDTSTNYNNEGAVGEAIRRSVVPRNEILVTSKLPGAAHAYDQAIEWIQESLYRLGLDYFDQYLIHWPLPKQDKYVEAWQALVDAQKFGLIRSIGVSNFLPEHLDRVIDATGVTPAVNQIERHPYFNNQALVDYNNQLGIVTQAWSPFGRDKLDILGEKALQPIAEKYGKAVSQIVLRWNIQNGVIPIVKAASYKNQVANLDVFDFELLEGDIALINQLDRGEEGRVEGQHPNTYEEFD
ncbi:aldo/keto reductase [Fundicoccus culcitae]|uniref:Aldo/keto reductase n=2 Tax=Fundicoccus culcitae TaxID=2969821 RepID=A0ABY5P9C9_9LACT|nr:aldo/keto reductase [Fundicoccus culcitae]UUX35357.1 aldo/keto reductase [Fundicoccus culcitae]